MFVMAAVPNSFGNNSNPTASGGGGGGGAGGGSSRRKSGRGRAGNVFGTPSSMTTTSTTAADHHSSGSSSSSSSGGGGFGAAMDAAGLLEMDENDNSYPWGLLHHNELAHMLSTGLGKTMVIDSRSFLEYNTSNVQQSVNVCCSKLVKRRLQQDKVHVLDLLHQTCNVGADETWDVVVYDQCTEDPSLLTPDNFVQVLLHKLSTTFNSVAFLKGGFLAFHASHPKLTESKSCSHRCSTLTSLSQPCMPVSNVGPTRILPFLYLGSQQDSLNHELAQVNGISYILNVSKTCPCPSYIQENHFYRIPVNDNYCEKLLPYFEEAFQFLDKVREANGCVLVHCLGGVSRSATLTIAYIMKHMRMSSDEAYRYVKDKRPTISPNFNFLGQLIEYEKVLRQGALEEEKRRLAAARALPSPGEECGSSSPAVMDLHSTAAVNTSPSSPGSRTLAVHRGVPSALGFRPAGLPLSGLASPPSATMLSVQNNQESFPPPPSSLSGLPSSDLTGPQTTADSSSQECPFPGPPDSTDLAGITSPREPTNRQSPAALPLASLDPAADSGEGEQLFLRQKRLGSSRRPGLRPTSAPTPYTGSLLLPGPLLQHKQLLEAVVRQDAVLAKSLSLGDEDRTASSEADQSFPPLPGPATQATSLVCSVTGFPSPGLPYQDYPQSTCSAAVDITGFPGPDTLEDCPGGIMGSSFSREMPHQSSGLLASGADFTIPKPEQQQPLTATYHHDNQPEDVPAFPPPAHGLDIMAQNPMLGECAASVTDPGLPDNSVDPSTISVKHLLKDQHHHQQHQQQQQQRQTAPNKRFSLSSMFSGFRWRSRPPTLPLSSPVSSMKKRSGDSGMVDSRVQLTPVSEGVENCDLNPSDASASTAADVSVSVTPAGPSEPVMMDDRAEGWEEEATVLTSSDSHFNASSLTSGYSSLQLSSSAPSLSSPSTDDDMSNNSSSSSTISKPGSLRLRAKGFTLALSSPTSNFPVKFSPTGAPSPSDWTNKRKSFLPSTASTSPDKLAKTDTATTSSASAPPQAAGSAMTPPKTLSLAQSTMGKLKQRLSGKKSLTLPLSSPTAAMAKLNFASPSTELPVGGSPLLSDGRLQPQEEAGDLGSQRPVSGGEDTARTALDLVAGSHTSEEHKSFRKGKEHKKGNSKSLFHRKSRWTEERSSSKLESAAAQKHRSDTPMSSSSLLAAFSPGSSMSSSSASSKMSLSFSSSTMSSSSYSDMSSSSNISSSSPPPHPPPSLPSSSSSSTSQHSGSPAAAATPSLHLQGLSQFPTTSLDKLSFTPCYTKDIVQELRQREASARKASGSNPIPASGDASSSNPSALDSPMSISSGSSAPSVASSTLSPVEAGLGNPFGDSTAGYGGPMAEEDLMENLAAYPLPESPQRLNSQEEDNEDGNPSAMPAFLRGTDMPIPEDLPLMSPTDFDPLSPSSLPQATLAPTLPTTPSSFYCSSSSIEPLSPMSLSDNSDSSSPIRSPTRHYHHHHGHHQHHLRNSLQSHEPAGGVSSSSSSSCIISHASACIVPPVSSLGFPGAPASSLSGGASSSMSSSITSPLSSLSQLSSASSLASTSKVVLRRHRGGAGSAGSDGKGNSGSGGSGSSKHVILDRPNSIAFSHYPTCDLVQPSPSSNAALVATETSGATATPSPASLDDASEVYMTSVRRSHRQHGHWHHQHAGGHHAPDVYSRHGRTSWGGYSEREVYRQITAAMETAMLRTQAYSRRLGSGVAARHTARGQHSSRKARSLDDILDSSSSASDVEFISARRFGPTGAKPYSTAGASGAGGRYADRQKEPYHCGLRSGSEPYHSSSSLSSNGSHGSSLEIIQVS